MNKEYKKLIIVLSCLFIILISFILYLSVPFINGKTVVLKTIPVDPFDMFRGQYLNINYDITSVPKIEDAKIGDSIYVTLIPDKDVWVYKSSSLVRPTDELFIKGTIIEDWNNKLRVEYGIEQYFFEKNAEINITNMTVEAKIGTNGKARIVRLLHEGKPLEIRYQDIRVTS